MTSTASRFVLPVMTLASWAFMFGTLSQTPGNPVYAFVSASTDELAWPDQNSGMPPSDQQAQEQDLLEIPLDSLEFEVRRLATQYGWSATWFRLLLPTAVKMTCGVEFSALSLSQKIEHANLFAFKLSENLSPESRQALGRAANLQAMHQELMRKVERSTITPLDLESAVDQRLTAIFPKSEVSDIKQQDSVVLLALHLVILDEVLDGVSPQPTIYVAEGSACPAQWPELLKRPQPQSPLRLAAR